MRSQRFLRSVRLSCLALLGVFGSVESPGAELSPLAVIDSSVRLDACGAGLASASALQPMLRYGALAIEIGHTSFDFAGFGGSVDIDASNSPDFNKFATLVTNGTSNVLTKVINLFNVGPALEELEANVLEQFAGDGFIPDLAGARLTFVRLVVGSLDAGLTGIACQGMPGLTEEFVSATVRWEFWGESRLAFNVNTAGCNPCSAGQLASFVAKIANSGSPVSAELKLNVTPQTGPPINLLVNPVKVIIPAGESVLPLASFHVPGEAANGSYLIEAVLTDPVRGVTLAWGGIVAVKQ